jgi:CO/xanthine dehydrogenase FAD-binding subunit
VRPFDYVRPTDLEAAVDLLARHGQQARVLAGGTDLVIRLRDGTYSPTVVIDVKHIPELARGISEVDGALRITAGTTMTDLCEDDRLQASFPALVEAARIVGSIQIRNRATLVGNLCNASPAADTAPPLLAYGAVLEIVGPGGRREVALDDFFVRSGVTTLGVGELVLAVRLPVPAGRVGSAFQRRTRRRGHDLASVTLAVVLDESGALQLSFGSLGPRPFLLTGAAAAAGELIDRAVTAAQPSSTSMRAGPEYRVAMLRVLAERAVATARARLADS